MDGNAAHAHGFWWSQESHIIWKGSLSRLQCIFTHKNQLVYLPIWNRPSNFIWNGRLYNVFASKSLTSAKGIYGQIDRETLSIFCGYNNCSSICMGIDLLWLQINSYYHFGTQREGNNIVTECLWIYLHMSWLNCLYICHWNWKMRMLTRNQKWSTIK